MAAVMYIFRNNHTGSNHEKKISIIAFSNHVLRNTLTYIITHYWQQKREIKQDNNNKRAYLLKMFPNQTVNQKHNEKKD